ncbi:MAG TPA: NAD(P)-binding domain-containing protein [Polyangia bacterium]
MKVGILGSGLMGAKLGTILARSGHEVVFSYARSKEKLDKIAADAGGQARAGTPKDAAQCEAVLLAVHWSRIDDVLAQAGDLAGKVLVTCSLPLNANNTELVIGHSSSGAETLAMKVKGARVVSAFHTLPSEVLFSVYDRRNANPRPNLVYSGDDAAAKTLVAGLIRDAGFDPVDAGPLRTARYTEPYAVLIGRLAYGGPGGPELCYRFARFRAPG